MAYSSYDAHAHTHARYTYEPSHGSSYRTSRDTDADSRRPPRLQPAMRSSYNEPGSYHSTPYYSYEPRHPVPPPRPPPHSTRYRNRWPPSPSVEDERAALTREVRSSAGSAVEDGDGDGDGDGDAKARGGVDQYPIIQEIEQPANGERRFVLVSDAIPHGGVARDKRRRSVADRGNMPHLNTDLDNQPLVTERTSTPYAYTKPQKESLAPSPGEHYLSPEAVAPSSSSIPTSFPTRNRTDGRDQNAKPAKQFPLRPTQTAFSRPPSPTRNREDVFDDSDAESDTSHLRTERQPARYSFVKSDLQKEHLRTNVLDSHAKSDPRRREASPLRSSRREAYAKRSKNSTSSSSSTKQHTPASDSPRSSNSSLNGEPRKSRPAPLDPANLRSSKYSCSRPSSPRLSKDPSPPRSPRLPPRRPPSPNTSRPSSRSGRPASPLSSSRSRAEDVPRAPITEADWHATYPPATNRSRPTTRPERYDTMPVPPMPHINIKSPSPARAARADNPLPYPVDDRPTEAFMPPEEEFQHDHSYASYTPIASSPRLDRLESPISSSPRERPSGFRPQPSNWKIAADDVPRSPRARSNSVRSQNGDDGARKERKTAVPLSLDRPLPSCPRSEPSSKYTDWYTLQNCPSFDICASCYEGVFADTPFSRYLTQGRRYERPVERFCDFSSPWMRLAWLLTIKQRRQSPDLLYTLATIVDQERPCPGDRELGTDHTVWYGVSDPRDGIHVANFALCPCDLRMIEELFPSIKGYFTRIPSSTSPYAIPSTYTCRLRVKSRRFPKYLDLLVELDAEAQALNQHPHIARFVQLAREHAFKAECQRDKPLLRKAWHFIPLLPELTVCQECFDELIWPHLAPPTASSPSTPSTIPKLFTRIIQPVPGEDLELGSSCCLYSPRMRTIFETAVREENFGYLERKVLERKSAEARLGRERRDILGWMDGLERGTWEWEKAKVELRENEDEWRGWE
ncbi:hypothetical protein PMIN06_005219 [Paraphaeosphaeria minitans]|uniref:Ser arg-related nuclear matrix protein n=1 Tax=Paraphaeosphaeria minitans TaxID=565426 RepID=A0A9P6KTE7_9PLEO|nr:ser arg-related nuclear matrix protein [Paraphaeosphaeria minitans]